MGNKYFRYINDTERIEEIRKLLCSINPLNEDSESDNSYSCLANCVFYRYVNIRNDELYTEIPKFVNEILSSVASDVKEQTITELLELFNTWKYEDAPTKEDYEKLEQLKIRAKKKYYKRKEEFCKGFWMGMLVMFMVMLKVILEMR